MRNPIDPAMTVNEITAQYPATIAVFNDVGIDACCGGDLALAEAASRDNVTLADLVAALESAITDDVPARPA